MPNRAETNASVRRWLDSWDLENDQMERLSNLITDCMFETGNMNPDNHQLLVWTLSGLALWLNSKPLDELLASIPPGIPLTDGSETKPAGEWNHLVVDLRDQGDPTAVRPALMIDGRIHLVTEDGSMEPSHYLSTVPAWTSANPD